MLNKTIVWVVAAILMVSLSKGGEPGITYNWSLDNDIPNYPYGGSRGFAADENMLIFGYDQAFYIYERDSLTFVRQYFYDNHITYPAEILIDSSSVYVAYKGNGEIQERGLKAFDKDGCSLSERWSKWQTAVCAPIAMSMDAENLYIADNYACAIFVYDKADGSFVVSWRAIGPSIDETPQLTGVAVVGESIYVSDLRQDQVKVFTKDGVYLRSFDVENPSSVKAHGAFVYVGTSSGLRVYDQNDNLMWRSSTQDDLADDKVYDDNGRLLVMPCRHHLTGPIDRTLGIKNQNALPLPEVLSVAHRRGTHVLDIDYRVVDSDDTNVTAHAVAFVVGLQEPFQPSLSNLLVMSSFVDGTQTNIGAEVSANMIKRFSWNMETDGVVSFIPSYGNIKVSIMAKDRRQSLIDFCWLHIPALNSNPALTINRVPLLQPEFLSLWFWLLASDISGIELRDGCVYGTEGEYNGLMLASGTVTTEEGISFLLEQMNVRKATVLEIQIAEEGATPGVVQLWDPLRTPPPSGSKVNSIGFVTDPVTDGVWVVPLAL